MMISIRPLRLLDDDVQTRQEFDLDFLRSGYRRMVYVSTDPEYRGELSPRRPRSPLTILPIPTDPAASIRLTYMDLKGRIETIEMKPAHSYYIPPNISYRIETRGRLVLELFGPADSWTQCFDEEVLAKDFFDRASRSGDSPVGSDATPKGSRAHGGQTAGEAEEAGGADHQ
ncbi:MAG TPA: hypothetical protein VGG03_03050 [Thermoanaerobaculia bacterium]|jgi:hypothetical protein